MMKDQGSQSAAGQPKQLQKSNVYSKSMAYIEVPNLQSSHMKSQQEFALDQSESHVNSAENLPTISEQIVNTKESRERDAVNSEVEIQHAIDMLNDYGKASFHKGALCFSSAPQLFDFSEMPHLQLKSGPVESAANQSHFSSNPRILEQTGPFRLQN